MYTEYGTDDETKRGIAAILTGGGKLPPMLSKVYSECKLAGQPGARSRVQLLLFTSLVVLKRIKRDDMLVRAAVRRHVAEQGEELQRLFREMHAVSGAGLAGLRRALATLVLDARGRLRRSEQGEQLWARVPSSAFAPRAIRSSARRRCRPCSD